MEKLHAILAVLLKTSTRRFQTLPSFPVLYDTCDLTGYELVY